MNPTDNDNSFIYTRDPTIYHLLPNQRQSPVTRAIPIISAYLFPKVGSVVDTSAISLNVDGATYKVPGASYDLSTKLFSYTLPQALPNGQHTLILSAGSSKDTVTFFVQAGFVQILNQGPLSTWKPIRTIYGSVTDTSVKSARIIRNSVDTFTVSISNQSFAKDASLKEGANVFVVEVDSAGSIARSSAFTITRLVNHAPSAKIGVVDGGATITLTATESTDPDSGQSALLTYDWSTDSSNPEAIAGVDGSKFPQLVIQKPRAPGEYYFGLIATDPNGNRDTTRNYFTMVHPDSAIKIITYASVPSWVRQGRVYELFFKAFTSEGTIIAAIPRLSYIKDMGFNIIWVMPVMTNLQINNSSGTGYNIIDFYTVTPQYGTNQDFKNFVSECHR
ncbi:MAG: alpha-amylase family glycosyl hydrolase, partial [Bacteroidota bacterium]